MAENFGHQKRRRCNSVRARILGIEGIAVSRTVIDNHLHSLARAGFRVHAWEPFSSMIRRGLRPVKVGRRCPFPTRQPHGGTRNRAHARSRSSAAAILWQTELNLPGGRNGRTAPRCVLLQSKLYANDRHQEPRWPRGEGSATCLLSTVTHAGRNQQSCWIRLLLDGYPDRRRYQPSLRSLRTNASSTGLPATEVISLLPGSRGKSPGAWRQAGLPRQRMRSASGGTDACAATPTRSPR